MRVITLVAIMFAGIGGAHAGDLDIRVMLSGQVAPGVYGQVQIGNDRPPPVVYAQPMMVEPIEAPPPPIYLHVPPGHEKHWSKHCAQYNACGRPVYFVRDDWYNNEYVPRYQHGGDDQGGGHGHGRGHDKGHGHGDKHGDKD